MTVGAIREKLSDYIRIADDEKIKAMYVLLRNEIEEEPVWWQNKQLLQEMDTEYDNWKSGKAEGYTIDEVSKEMKNEDVKRGEK